MPSKKKPHIEVIARGLLTDGSRVLLCQSRAGGYCYLPGGHVDPGEAAADALAREFKEETGLAASVGAPLLLSEQVFRDPDGTPHHEILLVFHVERLRDPEGDPTTQVESIEDDIAFAWFELAEIAQTDVRPPRHKAWLAAGGAVTGEPVAWASDAPRKTSPESADQGE